MVLCPVARRAPRETEGARVRLRSPGGASARRVGPPERQQDSAHLRCLSPETRTPRADPEKAMAAHPSDIELVIEVLHDSKGENPKAHYRLFVGGHPVEYDELRGVKNVLAQALISHILASRMSALKNADHNPPTDLPGSPGQHWVYCTIQTRPSPAIK